MKARKVSVPIDVLILVTGIIMGFIDLAAVNTEWVAPPTYYCSRNTQMAEEKFWNENKVLQGSNTYKGVKFKILAIPFYAQQTPSWCWAASGEMIMTYLGLEVPQCMQVNNRSKHNNCCQIPRPGTCKETSCYPDYENYGFKYECSDKALKWDELVNQMDTLKPVGFSWEFTDLDKRSGGHYMVARGYILLNDIKLVLVNDPSPWNKCKCQGGSLKIISYNDYVEYPDRYTHGYDDYDFK